MLKKQLAILTLVSMLTGTAAISAAAAETGETEKTTWITNGSFERIEDGAPSREDAAITVTGCTLNEIGEAQDGDNFYEVPDSAAGISVVLSGLETEANYVFSFYAKTSAASSITASWWFSRYAGEEQFDRVHDYWIEKGIPYNSSGQAEGSLTLGVAADTPAWEKQSVEIRVPRDTTHVTLKIAPASGTVDAARAVDALSLVKAENDYVLDGDFESSYSTTWLVDSTTETGSLVRRPNAWRTYRSVFSSKSNTSSVLLEEDGNHFMRVLKYAPGGTEKGSYAVSTIHSIHETGIYKLTFRRRNAEADDKPRMRLIKANDGVSSLTSYHFSKDTLATSEGWQTFTAYFTVTTADSFYLQMDNEYYNKTFDIDDVSIVKVSASEVNYTTAQTALNKGADTNLSELKITPAAGITPSAAISAYGIFVPEAGTAATANFLHALYKVEGGKTTLVSVVPTETESTAGEAVPFTAAVGTIPAEEEGVSYYIKSLCWDSISGMQPIGETAVLQ